MLSTHELADRLERADSENRKVRSDSIRIVPKPDIDFLRKKRSASIDLRLGRWFRTFRHSRVELLTLGHDARVLGGGNDHASPTQSHDQHRLTKEYFIPFGHDFVLHPAKFVIGITLEWVRLPATVACHITGRSSLGRRGLVIETAAGVHPGFTGCLAMEIANLGEVPISLVPGTRLCQLFFHELPPGSAVAASSLAGHRKPIIGAIPEDVELRQLAEPLSADSPAHSQGDLFSWPRKT